MQGPITAKHVTGFDVMNKYPNPQNLQSALGKRRCLAVLIHKALFTEFFLNFFLIKLPENK